MIAPAYASHVMHTTPGDVDVLIMMTAEQSENAEQYSQVLWLIISRLRESGFLTDDLTQSSEKANNKREFSTYMGVCKLPGEGNLHRRIDIKVQYRNTYHMYALLLLLSSLPYGVV